MITNNDLLKSELQEDGNYRITFITDQDVGYSVERLSKDGHFIKEIIERRILDEYVDFYPAYIDDEYNDYTIEIEEMENDKRVMDQYDPDYFEFLERIKYKKYLGVPGLDTYQIERLWKLYIIRKIMNGK